jgi:hypothetical protein
MQLSGGVFGIVGGYRNGLVLLTFFAANVEIYLNFAFPARGNIGLG